jgi:hypothetical protein
MEENPDIPEAADDAAPEDSGSYAASDRLMAAVGLLGVVFLAYVFMDVMANGQLTRALVGTQLEADSDDG